MAFKPMTKLEVKRTLSDSTELMVGVLTQNRQGVYFQFDQGYLGRVDLWWVNFQQYVWFLGKAEPM